MVLIFFKFLSILYLCSGLRGISILADNFTLIELNSCCELWENVNQTYTSCADVKNDTKSLELKIISFPSHVMSNRIATNFEIRSHKLQCKFTNTFEISLILHNLNSTIEVQPNGYLKAGNSSHIFYYERDKYCINGVSTSNLQVIACEVACNVKTPCIHKCCPINQFLNYKNRRCEDYAPDAIQWKPQFWTNHKNPTSQTEHSILPWVRWMPLDLHHCNNRSVEINYADAKAGIKEGKRVQMRENGQLDYWHFGKREWLELESDFYCMDGINRGSGTMLEATFVCPSKLPKARMVFGYFGILLMFCSMFSLLTVIVYIILWDKQNIHGWTIMCHGSAHGLFYMFLGIGNLIRKDTDFRNSLGCILLGTLSHFFSLSTFAWLTMISFDLWMTFRGIAAPGSKFYKRFLFYSLFGWGIPSLVVGLSWTLEILYSADDTSTVKVPNYGAVWCNVSPFTVFEYAYVPCMILLTASMICFFLTSWNLHQHRKSTRIATRRTAQDQQSYTLFVKLFFVVGALWIITIIDYIVFGLSGMPWYKLIPETISTLQPIAIFVIFVCKVDIIKSLMDKLPRLKPCLMPMLIIVACGKQNALERAVTLTTTASRPSSTLRRPNTRVAEEEGAV